MTANLPPDERPRIADAIEARACADMYAAAPAALGLRAETVGGALALLAPKIPVSYFNRAIGIGVQTPAAEADVDALVARFKAAGAADWWIHLNPVARPAGFVR